MSKIKVFAYERVSTENQVTDWNWILGQQWAIDAYCLGKGYDVKHYQDDWVSWSKEHRTWLDTMLKDLMKANKDKNNPKIPYVIVDDIDRFARDMKIWINVRDKIESTWAKIISLKQALEDSPEWEFSAYITMAAKVYERANNKRRVRSRQEMRLRDWFWCFGLPIWYKYIKNPHWWGKITVPDEPTFSLIAQWLKLLANWTLPTQSALVKYYADKWVKTRAWKPINNAFVSRIINRWELPFYAGFINFPKRWIEMVKGKHKAAITEEEYYRIAERYRVRDFYKDYTPNDISNRLELRRVLRCWHCWSLISWAPSTWVGWTYYYYYCFNKKCHRFRKSINADYINLKIEELLWMLTLDERYLEGFKVIVEAIWKEKWEVNKLQVTEKEKRIKQIDIELDNAVTKLANTDKEIIYKALEEKIEKLDQEKKQLQGDLLSLSNWTIDLYVKEFDALKSIIQCPLSIRKSGDLWLRRLIISNIFNNSLAYSDGEWLRTNEIPLVYAQNPDFEEKIKHFIKTPLRTLDSPVGNLYNWISIPLVEVRRIELRSKRHTHLALPLYFIFYLIFRLIISGSRSK